MLAADKLQLQSALKQQATALKEKEFNLHHSNFMTVGTQAAVLAALDVTMFIEFTPPDISTWEEPYRGIAWIIKGCYYTVIVSAFCANMIVVSQTTTLSVLGAGLALRGPDGSMMTATEGLYQERSSVFKTFGLGLTFTVGSVLLSVWLILHWENALLCWFIAMATMRRIFQDYRRVATRFDYDESDTVDFSDILLGPAANIRAVPAVVNQVLMSATGGNKADTTVAANSTTNSTRRQQQQSILQRAVTSFGWGKQQHSDIHNDNDNNAHEEDVEQQQLLLIQKSSSSLEPSMKQRKKGAPL